MWDDLIKYGSELGGAIKREIYEHPLASIAVISSVGLTVLGIIQTLKGNRE